MTLHHSQAAMRYLLLATVQLRASQTQGLIARVPEALEAISSTFDRITPCLAIGALYLALDLDFPSRSRGAHAKPR